MQLRHLKKDDAGKFTIPCTAIEDIQALARNPNGWMHERQIDACKNFSGTEQEAEELRARLEKHCTESLEGRRMYQ